MLVGATQPLTADAAQEMGYTLTAADCAELLAVGERVVRGWFRAPADDPSHLSSVLVSVRGPAARRVRLADLQDLAARLSLPTLGELIRPGDAIEIIAGRRLRPGTTAYIRHFQRLESAVLAGHISEYS